MPKILLIAPVFILLAATVVFSGSANVQSPVADGPQFTADNRMLRPDNYREWVWLSSGFGMSYTPNAQAAANPPFDNVFVNPTAYRTFRATGKWPDQTVLVLEIRHSASRGSINQSGHYQGSLDAMEVHVKDQQHLSGWAFVGFGADAQSARPIPASASCYSCHQQHGAVDTTFVQFYPTLLEVAQRKNTLQKQF